MSISIGRVSHSVYSICEREVFDTRALCTSIYYLQGGKDNRGWDLHERVFYPQLEGCPVYRFTLYLENFCTHNTYTIHLNILPSKIIYFIDLHKHPFDKIEIFVLIIVFSLFFFAKEAVSRVSRTKFSKVWPQWRKCKMESHYFMGRFFTVERYPGTEGCKGSF